MRDAKRVAQVNAELAQLTVTTHIDISLSCDKQFFRLTSSDGRLVLRIEPSASQPEALASIVLSSRDAALKALASGGGRAALAAMLTNGDLKLRGNALFQLTTLHEELDLDSATIGQLTSLAHELLFEDYAPWVPDDAATDCMRCATPFSFRRRRHHCRRCGKLFCSACAPRPTTSRAERLCMPCAVARPTGAVRSASTPTSAPPEAPANASAAEWLLESHIENELRMIARANWLVAALAVALAGVALAMAWPSTQRQWATFAALGVLLLALRPWIYRYARVANVCCVIGFGVMATTMRVRGRPDKAQVAAWELAHRVNARYIFDSVSALGGFWVKLAQGASVFSGLPEAFNAELSRLQDAMPADPISEVHAILRAELGPRWHEVVLSIEPTPIGCATIAQVHRATLRVPAADADETSAATPATLVVEAVLKVQHPLVSERLEIDIYASQLLARLLGYVAPMLFRDLKTVVRDLAEITRGELDFRQEASNQRLGRRAVASMGLDVRVPHVFESVVTKRILAMEYVEGTRLTDIRSLDGVGEAEVRKVVLSLVQYYGATMHGPIFHCDPHPGNLLVEADGTLVILDWGQAQRLSVAERLAYARLFAGIMMEDFNVFADACANLGVPFENFETVPNSTPATMIGAMRFVLRLQKTTRRAAKEDYRALESTLGGLSDDIKSIQGGGTDLFKGPLMPFSKTIAMLVEVATLLGCALPILNLLTAEGYRYILSEGGYAHVQLLVDPDRASPFTLSLLPSQQPPARVELIASPGRSPLASPSRSPLASPGFSPLASPGRSPRHEASPQSLQGSMAALLATLQSEGIILGAQLCVLDATSGTTLVDVAVGHCTWHQPEVVTPQTVFNISEISKLLVAACVLRLVERGSIAFTTKVSGDVTLEQVLSHTAGHIEMLASGVSSFLSMLDMDAMAALAASTPPTIAPGARQQYHHTSFGWLLAHACKLAGSSLQHAWNSLMDEALGAGGASRVTLQAPGSDRPPGSAFNGAPNTPGSSTMQDGEASHPPIASGGKTMTTATMEQLLEELGYFSSVIGAGAKKDATAAERADGKVWLSMFGKPQWIEQSAYASPRARRAALPGLVAYATARDVAAVLHAVAAGRVLAAHTVDNALRSRKPPPSDLSTPTRMPLLLRGFEDSEWGLGIQIIKPPIAGRPGANGTAGKPACWGHVSANGSFAFVIAGRRPLVATMLLNRTLGQQAAERVLTVLREVAAGRGAWS